MNATAPQSIRKSSARELVMSLGDVIRRFGPPEAAAKEGILQELQNISIRNAKRLTEYHELLCFLRAYPDNPEILCMVESELQNFRERVIACLNADESASAALLNTGISGTVVEYAYDFDMALWLAEKFPGAVTIDWETYNDAETDNLSTLLPLLVTWPENDTLDDPEV
ncbi:MAG: hypothetical protein FJY66_05955, partial [Calditrichaeota bacterium]|nr:hypothetical protein [Calditrichota bacterium]